MCKKVYEFWISFFRQASLKGIIKLARENRVAIILQTYPHVWPSNPVNSVIEKTSHGYNVPVIDNEAIFIEKLKYNDEAKFFVKDGHCNKEGYKIIAENAYNALLGNLTLLSAYTKDAKQ